MYVCLPPIRRAGLPNVLPGPINPPQFPKEKEGYQSRMLRIRYSVLLSLRIPISRMVKLGTHSLSAANVSRLNRQRLSSDFTCALTLAGFNRSPRFLAVRSLAPQFHALFTTLPCFFSPFAQATSSLSDRISYLGLADDHSQIRRGIPTPPSLGFGT